LLLKPAVSGYFPVVGIQGVVVKTGNRGLLLALLLVIGPAFAEEDVGLGPWRLGMTKEQVAAIADKGPYTDTASGGLEAATTFRKKKVTTSFTFADSKVRSIVVKVYEGTDWRNAEQGALDVYDHFKESYGGANVKDTADKVERDALDLILRQTLGTAEELNKRYVANGSRMVITFDMVPVKQPAESRLHCQWIFDGKGTYSVYLYQDLPGAPKRDVAENVEIKKP